MSPRYHLDTPAIRLRNTTSSPSSPHHSPFFSPSSISASTTHSHSQHRPHAPSVSPAPSSSSASAALPMSIPGKSRTTPPPPLPPPRYIAGLNEGQDHGWLMGNTPARKDASLQTASASVRAGSSLLGGASAPRLGESYSGSERSVDFSSAMKDATTQTPTSPRPQDSAMSESNREEMPGLSALLEYNKLQSEKPMGQRTLDTSSRAYDKSVLHRLGSSTLLPQPTTPDTAAKQRISNEESSAIAQNTLQRMNGQQVKPLSIASHLERRHSNESAAPRWTAQNHSPALSGLRSPFSDSGLDSATSYRAPDASPQFHQYRDMPSRPGHNRDSSGDNSAYRQADRSLEEASSPARASAPAHNASAEYQQDAKIGQKRRAQSPPTSERPVDPRLPSSHGNAPDAWGRTDQLMGPPRDLPQENRLEASGGSLSSLGSSLQQQASYNSSWNPQSIASSATSYSSERPSPPSYGAPTQQDSKPVSSYPPVPEMNSMAPLPPADNRPPPIPHRRQASSSIPRPSGLWICDCCPKKPKKFENEADLRAHEGEKQYQCVYCTNRFKNKNEAERHQNSLHLRRHSWSCAALTGFDMAFHPTPPSTMMTVGNHGQYPPPAATDTCGYCGSQFNNPPNWDERVEHLNVVHKFGECNVNKKFFRADHFRQHLKHSHAGSSGKWTNQLENACMKDEPPPQPIHSSMVASPASAPSMTHLLSPIDQSQQPR